MSVTPSPTVLTVPEKSRPGTKGNFVCLYSPRRTFQSAALTLVAATSMTTSPGPATGSGKSPYWRTSGPPNRSINAAFISHLPPRPRVYQRCRLSLCRILKTEVSQHVRNETNGLRKAAITARADRQAYSDRSGVPREHGADFRGGPRNDERILDVPGQGQRRHS